MKRPENFNIFIWKTLVTQNASLLSCDDYGMMYELHPDHRDGIVVDIITSRLALPLCCPKFIARRASASVCAGFLAAKLDASPRKSRMTGMISRQGRPHCAMDAYCIGLPTCL